MMTITRRMNRATPISLVWETCRVPFGLMPVMAAMAAMTTARVSQTSQLTMNDSIHVNRGALAYTFPEHG